MRALRWRVVALASTSLGLFAAHAPAFALDAARVTPAVTLSASPGPVPPIGEQNVVVRIPPHAPVKVLPGKHKRPPRDRAPSAGGTGQSRGGLPYTGVALLGLLVLAASLVATGSAVRWGARERTVRAVQVLGAALTVVGGIGVALVCAGGTAASRASEPADGLTAPSPPGSGLAPVEPGWPSERPRASLRVLGPSGLALLEPIVAVAGQQLTVVASGFAANDGVLVHPGDAGPGTARLHADAGGTVRFLVVITPGIAPGPHTVSLVGSRLTAAVAFTVTVASNPERGRSASRAR